MSVTHVNFNTKQRLAGPTCAKRRDQPNRARENVLIGGCRELLAADFKTIRGRPFLDVCLSYEHPSPEDFLATAVVRIYHQDDLLIEEKPKTVIILEDLSLFGGETATDRFVLRLDGTRFAPLLKRQTLENLFVEVQLFPDGLIYSWDYLHLAIMSRLQKI